MKLNPWNLTADEMVTMQALTGPAAGHSKQAARMLKIEPVTVDRRVLRVRQKMHAKNRLEAILIFDRAYREPIAQRLEAA